MPREKATAAMPAVQDADARAYVTCKACSRRTMREELREALYVCPHCGAYFPMTGEARMQMLLDPQTSRPLFDDAAACDPIGFPGYAGKLERLHEQTGMTDAALACEGAIDGLRCVLVVLDSRFMMGSMGTAVGERVTLAAEYAGENGLPLIVFSASGGARMQEGVFSLMQMAKTSAAIAAFSDAGGLYISCLTHPTTGGVTASFASLGDIILAEPGALIGFAGQRVVEQTIGARLPDGFQRSEFQMEHGFVDAIVPRDQWRQALTTLLRLHAPCAAQSHERKGGLS